MSSLTKFLFKQPGMSAINIRVNASITAFSFHVSFPLRLVYHNPPHVWKCRRKNGIIYAMPNWLHNKLGDFWWYSAMIFIACRSGDIIQAFIGLWLVPRYVGQAELGAVLPLQQLCGLFAVPLAILAIVFSKYVNTYVTRGELGKVKAFIRDVLVASTIVFLISITIAYLIVPYFYERIRVASGSLTLLILITGFATNISQLFTNALQGFKKFKHLTVINLISAPIRLITMLVSMPFRALSGYVLGQATPPATTSFIAACSLRRELRHIPLDTSWRHDIPSIFRYLWPVAIYTAFSTLFATIAATIYRQRLPEIESAAYYLISRFSETAGYVGLSMTVVLFPLAAEAHEKGDENTSILRHTLIASTVSTGTLATLFFFLGQWIFSLSETWKLYLPYVQLMPWATLIAGAATVISTIISYEMACQRFGVAYFTIIFNVITTAILLSFTGFEFYRGILPDNVVDWMAIHHLANLTRIFWFCGVSAIIQITVLFTILVHRRKH